MIAVLFAVLKLKTPVVATRSCDTRNRSVPCFVLSFILFLQAVFCVVLFCLVVVWFTDRRYRSMNQEQEEAGISSTSRLWIFGYGSLCWHPGFEFDKSLTGYIRGFSRKFWQGNTAHRGTENKVNINIFHFTVFLLLFLRHSNVKVS